MLPPAAGSRHAAAVLQPDVVDADNVAAVVAVARRGPGAAIIAGAARSNSDSTVAAGRTAGSMYSAYNTW